MALVLAPEPPVEDWLDALDTQIKRSPSFFDGRPVVLDLGALPIEQPNVAGLLHTLHPRDVPVRPFEKHGLHIDAEMRRGFVQTTESDAHARTNAGRARGFSTEDHEISTVLSSCSVICAGFG